FAAVNITGQEKWSGIKINENSMLSDAIEGLIALGYKEQQARVAVTKTYEHNENIALEDLIKKSLQDL
ncbi:MAG: hypothetical protein LE168_04135, partial [Endomicrobium sp.]|nr:hypothetical protein [Endomicrobium sp.]